MKIKKIKLINFRNLDKVELNFINKINIIIGGNGAGKTNILEAIYLNSLTKSFRANNDAELIKFDKEFLTIMTTIKDDSYNENVLYNIDKLSKKIYLNSSKVTKLSEYIGKYPVVISTPEDVLMIKTSPSTRRDVLNISICQFNKEYFKTLNEYNKLLKLRNDYLKRILINSISDVKYFDILTNKLIEKAVYIYIERNNIKTYVIKNYIDGDEILRKSEEEIVIEDNEKKELIKNILETKKNDDNIKILLNVGRHSKEKNLNTMIEVFKNVLENSKNIIPYLIMLGDGKETDNIQKYIKENKLEKRIILLGKKKNPYPYFKISDYIFLTSLTEGYPVVFQEAMVMR